jgi:hypothetical protein
MPSSTLIRRVVRHHELPPSASSLLNPYMGPLLPVCCLRWIALLVSDAQRVACENVLNTTQAGPTASDTAVTGRRPPTSDRVSQGSYEHAAWATHHQRSMVNSRQLGQQGRRSTGLSPGRSTPRPRLRRARLCPPHPVEQCIYRFSRSCWSFPRGGYARSLVYGAMRAHHRCALPSARQSCSRYGVGQTSSRPGGGDQPGRGMGALEVVEVAGATRTARCGYAAWYLLTAVTSAAGRGRPEPRPRSGARRDPATARIIGCFKPRIPICTGFHLRPCTPPRFQS